MGTVFKVLGAIALVGIIGFAGILYCAHQTGSSLQDDFFAAVLSGDVAQLEAKFHPDLREEIDRPILAAWMEAVKEHLGAYKGMSGSNFNTSVNKTGGKTEVESNGKVEFEKGEAESKIKAVDDLIVAFHVTSSALPDVWLTELSDTSLYEERAQAFLRALASGDAEGSRAMMHESLRAQFGDAGAFEQALESLKTRFGPKVPMQRVSATFQAGSSPELIVRYALRDGPQPAIGKVRFGFSGLRGHILGFALPE